MRHIIYSGMMNGLNIERCTRDSEYNMVKHWHPEVEFQFFVSGSRKFFIENQDYECKAGSVVIIDSGKVHNTYSAKELAHDRILLSFEKDKFAAVVQALGVDLDAFFRTHQGVVQIPTEDWQYFIDLMQDIANEVQEKAPNYQGIVAMRLTELLIYIDRSLTAGSRKKINEINSHQVNETVREVTDFIKENYKNVGSLEEIASRFYLDKSYLSRIFRRITGYTITEFTNIQKVQHAQKLLEDTDLPIATIALEVGYDNLPYFNRVFKKYIETSPLQYRKKQIAYKQSLREKNNL